MAAVGYVFTTFVSTLLSVFLFAMLARALLSWFDPMQEWKITMFLHVLTEPIILPVRALFERMHWLEGFPLDVPFMVTWLLLSVIQTLLTLP